MRFSYFEHDADVGVIGHGKTVEQAFEAAAQAVFAIMTQLDAVQVRDEITVDRAPAWLGWSRNDNAGCALGLRSSDWRRRGFRCGIGRCRF